MTIYHPTSPPNRYRSRSNWFVAEEVWGQIASYAVIVFIAAVVVFTTGEPRKAHHSRPSSTTSQQAISPPAPVAPDR
jgi:hypothetical protein